MTHMVQLYSTYLTGFMLLKPWPMVGKAAAVALSSPVSGEYRNGEDDPADSLGSGGLRVTSTRARPVRRAGWRVALRRSGLAGSGRSAARLVISSSEDSRLACTHAGYVYCRISERKKKVENYASKATMRF